MKVLDRSKIMAGLMLVAVLVASSAMATGFEVTPPTLDVTALGTYVTAILGGLAALWLARKYIKITNRS